MDLKQTILLGWDVALTSFIIRPDLNKHPEGYS
jgi:hypothetical protein